MPRGEQLRDAADQRRHSDRRRESAHRPAQATIVHEGRRLINRAIELAATFADGVFLVARMPDSVTLESVRTTCRLSILRPSDDPTATGPPPNPSR